RDAALPLLRCLVDRVEGRYLRVRARLREDLRDRGCERRLPVVDVSDRADVDVRLCALELLLCHLFLFLRARLPRITVSCRLPRSTPRSWPELPRSGRTAW